MQEQRKFGPVLLIVVSYQSGSQKHQNVDGCHHQGQTASQSHPWNLEKKLQCLTDAQFLLVTTQNNLKQLKEIVIFWHQQITSVSIENCQASYIETHLGNKEPNHEYERERERERERAHLLQI